MKFIIKWNAGYGDNYDVIEAKNQEEAQKAAYEEWREEVWNGVRNWRKN